MTERRAATEERMLLDLQIILGTAPIPATVTGGGGVRPRRQPRPKMLDVKTAAVLYLLGFISDIELAAFAAQG